jgi:hypothetical protein
MANANSPEIQATTLRAIWEQYRAQAQTSSRLKAEKIGWRRVLLASTVLALFLTPFSKTFDKWGFVAVSGVLTVVATLLFSLTTYFYKEMLGDDAEQPWVRCRQTSEGLKALAFRFLSGATPFDQPGTKLVLEQLEMLVNKSGIASDTVNESEARKNIPPAPLAIADYIKLRVEEQLDYFTKALDTERATNARVLLVGRGVSVAVVAFGALGAVFTEDWRDIWAPFLGAAATMATAQNARTRHRFLIDSYSNAAAKLKFARTRWEVSPKSPQDDKELVEGVEAILANENAGWVQQMLLKPVIPDAPHGAR